MDCGQFAGKILLICDFFFFLQVVMIGLLKVQILYSVHRDNKGNYKKTEIVTFGCNLSVPRFVLPRLAST